MTWLTTKAVADLIGKNKRTVERNYLKYDYRHVYGKGRGGKQLQIALESLPQPIQEKYYNIVPEYKPILQFTGKQREDANFRAWVVEQYRQWGLSPDGFIEKFNQDNPDDNISKSQLFRWQRKYKDGEVADLIDQRGGYNRGQSTISDEAWDYFYCLYMTQQKLKVRRCWDLTLRAYPDIPSVSAFERRVQTIPKYAIVQYREGERALRDMLPSMERSRVDIDSNDIWFSDHHIMDVFVKNESGKAKRLWLTVFFDARSNKVVSTLLRDADPNATAVKQCFRKGVEAFGIPNEVYFDNGKDYRSKSFSRDYPLSLVKQLGIGLIYATPYHGQAKTVERFFGTLEDRFGRLFPTYAGSNAKKRPECMQIPNEKIAEFAPTMKEFSTLLTDYIAEYNATPSRGIDMNNECPDKVYFDNLKVKRDVGDVDALRLLCSTSEERTVHKNGITIKNNTYRSEYLIPHLGEKVIATFDPDNIDMVSIFDLNNKAICVAYAHIKTLFRHTTDEDYQKAAKEKKAVRAFNKKYQPSRELTIHEIMARNKLQEQQYTESTDTKTVTQINPQISKNSKVLKSTEKGEHKRIREEYSVSAVLLKKYNEQKAIGG